MKLALLLVILLLLYLSQRRQKVEMLPNVEPEPEDWPGWLPIFDNSDLLDRARWP